MATARKRIKIGNDTADIHDARLPDSLGTAGQVLKMNSGANGIEWGSAITEIVGSSVRITNISKSGLYLLKYNSAGSSSHTITLYYHGTVNTTAYVSLDCGNAFLCVHYTGTCWYWVVTDAIGRVYNGETYASGGSCPRKTDAFRFSDGLIAYYGTKRLYKHTYIYTASSTSKLRFSIINTSSDYLSFNFLTSCISNWGHNAWQDISIYNGSVWYPAAIYSYSTSGIVYLARNSGSSYSTMSVTTTQFTTSGTTTVSSMALDLETTEWFVD